MGDWDTPPTAAEIADPWAAPPTPEEARGKAPKPEVSRIAAILGGVGQGGMMGWADEAKAGWRSLFPKSMGSKSYKEELADERAWHDAAREQHPVIYAGSEMADAIAPAVAGGVVSAGAKLPAVLRMLGAAGQGAVQGAGYSNAGDAKSLARDVGLGAGVGTLGFGAGEALGAAGRGLGRFARARSAAAVAKAGEKAAEEVAGGIKTATSSLGGEVQKGNRIVENLRRLGPELSPEQEALINDLEKRLSKSTLEALPSQAETIATKDAELAALKTGASDAFQSRKAELLSPAEAKQQLLSRALRYGPVALGSAAGAAIGGPLGSGVGALAGAGTRPMVRALLRMSKNPAVQKALFDQLAEKSEGPGVQLLKRLLASGASAPLTQELATP